ncbi:MAG: glycosyltransferase [Candidatus Omnitrophota bacterium]
MTVSIIIAVKAWQNNLEQCLAKCLELDFPDFEILILPDAPFAKEFNDRRIRVIPTKEVSPAAKRDIAVNLAKGEILAFLDDDAFPRKDWLKYAIINFKDKEIAAVGGPAVTPAEDTLRQKASGLVYSSIITSGSYVYRYIPGTKKEVCDYPSCNFLVRKSIMKELGGFNTNFWPGEDTKLCLDIVMKLKKKIVYDPKALVYHHRRPLFKGHLNQIASYALHRGYFVKRFPETSLRPSYFVPSLFLLFLLSGLVTSIFISYLRIFYAFGLVFYVSLVLIFSINNKLRLIPVVFSGIILTHLTYGYYFIKGLFSKRLKEE